jgi:nitroreductase
MNPVLGLLKNHRSIRRFSEQKISPELLNELLRAGQAAATSSFIQATSVIRVSKPLLRQEFVDLSGGQKYINSAAEFLVFCADLHRNEARVAKLGANAEFDWTEQFLTASLDVALFAQNVVVAAESEGLGICYIGGIRNDPQRVSDLLELPQLVYPVFGLCLGYPEQDPVLKPRLPLSSVLHQDRYQGEQNISAEIDRYDELVSNYYKERSGGKIDFSWSEQMKKQSASQSRPFMRDFLNKKGFNIR